MALNPRIETWAGRTVWLVGASSGIGRATASRLHARGAKVIVSARNSAALERFVAEHPGSESVRLDVVERAAVHEAALALFSRHGVLDLICYCAGTYVEMDAEHFDLDSALRHQQVNYLGVLHVMGAALPRLLAQGRAGQGGHLSFVSSVAGFRGLPKALAYGPTKAALINLAESLYFDLAPRGLGVSVVNPGFVETPLTAGNRFKMPALIAPDEAAREVVSGWERGQFEIHFPKRFTRLMKGLRHLGYGLYFAAVRRATRA